jgi:hypothetical protein
VKAQIRKTARQAKGIPMSDIFRPNWTSSHLDAEMTYALQATLETVEYPISFNAFSALFAEAVTGIMHERVPQTAELFDAKDLAPISGGVFSAKRAEDPEWFKNTSHYVTAKELTFAWLTYIHSLLLGAPSPLRERKLSAMSFDPFANAGGFCNPRKLKMLDEC